MSLESLYPEIVMDHYRRPRNEGTVPNPSVDVEGHSALCGDRIHIQLLIDSDEKIRDVKFSDVKPTDVTPTDTSCAISLASASMMTQTILGKPVDEALRLREEFKKMVEGKEVDAETMGDLIALQGVRNSAVRIKCALLAWASLKQGIEEFKSHATKGKVQMTV